MTQSVIVGAGLAGLLAAKRSLEEGLEATLIGELGGLIATTHLGKLAVDSGAEAFSTVGPEVLELANELGLADKICYPNPESARIIGRETRFRIPKGLMGIPADLADPELTEIFSSEEVAQAIHLDSLPFGEYETVEQLIQQRLGQPFLDRVVNPVLAGVHGSTAENLSPRVILGDALERARELESLSSAVAESKAKSARPGASVASLKGGMSTLVSTLLARLRAEGLQHISEPVLGLSRVPGGFTIQLETKQFQSARLSICTGAASLKWLSQQLPELAAVARVKTVDVAVVIALVESAQLDGFPLGTGALITQDSGFQAKATTHINAKWAWVNEQLPRHQHLIRLSYGRNGAIPPGDLRTLAASELSGIYGTDDLRVIQSEQVNWPSSLVQSEPALVQQLSSLEVAGLELAGGYLSGNGILGIVRDHLRRQAA